MSDDDPDLVLVGHPFAPIGMGEHVRSSWNAFTAAGGVAKIRDIYGLNSRTDTDFERRYGAAVTDRLSSKMNVFHINGDEVEQALPHLQDDERFNSAYNVIYPAWELSKYPRVWIPFIEKFDEVWAPSEFIRDAISKETKKPVVHMPLAVDLRMSAFMTRRALKLPESAFIFLFFFDYSSYMARKNPFATLEAFNRLVEKNPGAPFHLVLKHKGADTATAASKKRFEDAIAPHRDQVLVIDQTLSDNEVKNLVRAADCFVSLHRSEGFGRGLAEAMACGVPVVGTGYSGNMDFMSQDNAWLVDHKLIPVGLDEYPQAEGQHWAEPSIDHAVELMEQVWNDRAMARERAHRAQLDLRREFAPLPIGLRYLERLEMIKRKAEAA